MLKVTLECHDPQPKFSYFVRLEIHSKATITDRIVDAVVVSHRCSLQQEFVASFNADCC